MSSTQFRKFEIIDSKISFGKKSTIKQIHLAVSNAGIKAGERTIYNDIKAMEIIYKQKIIDGKDDRYFYEDDTFSMRKMKLSEEDEATFTAVSMSILNLKPTGIYDKYNKLVDKVLNDITKGKKTKNIQRFSSIQPEISFGNKGYEWIEPILNAITSKETIEVVYQKGDLEPEKKILSPYILKEFRNHWYCIGYDHSKSNLTKVYALDRILSIKESFKKYYTDPHFDLDAYFKYSFGIFHNYDQSPINLKLEFYNNYIESLQKHPLMSTQKSRLIKSGKALEVELELYYSGEILREILSYGKNVKVISPQIVVDDIKNQLNKMESFY